jgi:hypothetical protein
MTLLGTAAGWRLTRRLVDRYFASWSARRMHQLDALDVRRSQTDILMGLLHRAQDTQFGRQNGFADIATPKAYRERVRLRVYEDYQREYFGTFPRLDDVLWPGRVAYFALSSGTTSGSTKYLPISTEMLRSNRRAALTMLASLMTFRPGARLFAGKFFFLGGSTELVSLDGGALAGDLSGIASETAPTWMRPYTYPDRRTARIADWDEKLDRMTAESVRLPITCISGVPSWLLLLFHRLCARTGAQTIAEVWPSLRCIIHGGVSFTPYRELFRKVLGDDRITLQDCYPCSEGFVAFEDLRYRLLRPIPDNGIFYEFVPVAELGKSNPTRHALWEVVAGVQYAVVLTTCAGLWSYGVGDTVCFEQTRPHLFRFTGRTKSFLSAFGEHLIVEEVERAISLAARAAGTHVIDYHVGPGYPQSAAELGRHVYLVETRGTPSNREIFISALDEELCHRNEDYRAHRLSGTGMAAPTIHWLKPGSFAGWMRQAGKLGGQHKVPRLDNSGHILAEMLTWFQDNRFIDHISSCRQEA